jgi:hypothetical protein
MAARLYQANSRASEATDGRVTAVEARRRARRPWLLAGGCGAVVVASLAGGLAMGANHAPSPPRHPKLAAATPTWAPVTTGPMPNSPVTPAAVIYRLQQLLPSGGTSGFAGGDVDGSVTGQLYFDQGQGPGMVRVAVTPSSGGDDCTSPSSDAQTTCEHLADGNEAAVERISDNCIQSLVVTVDHRDGAAVQLSVASCLAWNGTTNPPGGPALTPAQAVQIADDPSWGLTMSSGLVATAGQQFPDLPPL